ALRQFGLGTNARACVTLELFDIAPLDGSRYGLDATSPFMQDLVAPPGDADVRDIAQPDEPAVGIAYWQGRHLIDAVTPQRIQHDDQIDDLVATEYLRRLRAFIRRLHGFEHGHWLQAQRCRALVPQANRQLRRAWLSLDLHVARARHFGEHRGNRQGISIQQIERRAVQIHDEGCRISGDGFLDALG